MFKIKKMIFKILSKTKVEEDSSKTQASDAFNTKFNYCLKKFIHFNTLVL